MEDKMRPAPAEEPIFGAPLPEPAGKPARKPFPTVGDLLAMLGIILGLQVLAGVVVTAAFWIAGRNVGALNPAQEGVFLALTYLLSMVPAYVLVLLYRRMRGGRGPVGRFSMRGLNPVLLLWGCLFLGAATVVCEPLLQCLPEPPEMPYGRGLWSVLSLVVAAPVLEELLCRGVILESLRSRYGVVFAWLVSSLFFGVLHLQPMLVVNAFVIGLILGFICIASESLWASMVLHAFNNGVAYLVMTSGHADLRLSEWVGNPILYEIIYIGAIVVTGLSAWKVWRKLRRLKNGTENEVSE